MEEPKEFNEGMYIAMRNRIFELEAKTINYAPFNRSRKRSVDRSMDVYPGYGYGYGYDHGHQGRPPVHSGYEGEYVHSSKRAAYHHPRRHSPPSPAYGPPRSEDRQYIYRHAPSYPSWYTPETYMSGSQPQHPGSRQVPPRTGDRESASGHSQVDHRNSRDSNGHDSGGPLSSPPRTLATKTQTVQPRPILPHRGVEAGGPTKMHHNPGSQPKRHSPPSHPSSSQYTHANPQSTEQLLTPTTPPDQHQLQQQQQEQQRQSFQQCQHRAQQQAQSDYSRSYHLQKHMRMLDQQRALKLAQQQQQQQAQQPVKIQRQYQPHQQMYPHSSSNPASSTQPQLSLQQQQQQQQHQASRMLAIHHHQQQQQSAQQQLIQRYQAQRLLQQKQLQARQPQELRQRATIAQSISAGTTLAAMKVQSLACNNGIGNGSGSAPATNTIEGADPRQKSVRPLECSNCMALDSLTWRPRVESGSSSSSSTQDSPTTAADPVSNSNTSTAEGRLLCPACIQYWQAHGKCRPVPPFRVNFLKKIHSRFKKELQEVRFQGWQDAQVLEVEDRMTELDWKRVFSAASSFDEAAANVRSRQTSISSSTAASSPVIHSITVATPVSAAGATEEGPIVIKIEDDDDDVNAIGSRQSLFSSGATAATSSLPLSEVKTFMSEAAVGEVFGQRWKTEPMVGYTLVHFGGSDRTRMVPMNPTVPSLTVTFSRATESVVFAFRVLVNGLCLLSSGGGPPALHMPEMEEDEEESDEECDQDQAMPERDRGDEDVEMESVPRPDDLTLPSSSSSSTSFSAEGDASKDNTATAPSAAA
ncbi:hypothetical protein BGZ47_001345 [Haplosporangium gracile]|nr:hypothetical protein BGZ47_001345 [Haplosporangium gracile]